RIEECAFVVLQIFVVSARQSFQRGEQGCEIAEDAGARAACELERIRVALLRHHARAGGERVAELNEREFGAAVEYEVFGEPREMCAEQRDREHQLGDEI